MTARQIVGFVSFAFVVSGSGCSPDERAAPADVPERISPDAYVGETWQLLEVLRVGQGGGVELHRVRGAAILSSGEIAIADAGNYRVALFSGAGTFQRSFGREGDGPAEYRNLMLLAGIGDTLATFDNVLARVALWRTDGSLIGTHAVPTFKGEPLDIRAVISTDEYIGTTRPAMDPERSTGIFTETVDVVRLRLSAAEIETMTDLEWRQLYQYAESEGPVTGVTVYQLPFLGQSRIVGGSAGVAIAHFSDREVAMLPTGASSVRQVPVPLAAHPFESRIVEQYRDSLIGLSSTPSPNTERRLRRVFGADFPSPSVGPTVGRSAYGNGIVWLEQHPGIGEDSSSWYAIQMGDGSVLGRVILPTRSAILYGDESTILVHAVDDLGVETVVNYRLLR